MPESLKSLAKLVKKLQDCHEDSELEFKEAQSQLPKAFWPTYSSFANTSGGTVVFGVREGKPWKIVGVDDPQKLISDLCNTANNRQKVNHNLVDDNNIQIFEISGKKLVSIYIPELPREQKPLCLDGRLDRAYIRKNEGDYLASSEELRRMLRNASDNLDGELLDKYTFDDLNLDSVLAFKNLIHARNPSEHYLEMDNIAFLTEMGVYQLDRDDDRKPKLTIAGLLFLGKLNAIYQRFPAFHLDYINRRGVSAQGRWKDRVATGDLAYPNLNVFEFFQLVKDKLKATIEDAFQLDENSVRKSPVELGTALREALANMLIHADYFDEGIDIKVVVDDYFYTFSNPGMMRVTEAQFFTGGISNPRNNTLITFFRRMGISDRAGTGGKTILNFARANKYEMPELIVNRESTSLKLWIAAPLQTHPEFDEETKQVYAMVHDYRRVSISQIMEATGISRYHTHNALQRLLNADLIRVQGKGRATVYLWSPSIIERVDEANHIRDMLIHDIKRE